MNVIVVDDEPIIRIGLRSMLDWEGAGLRLVGEAEDGEEAWTLLEALEVDLLITDLLMPRMDGLELLRRIKDQGKDVSTIVLSCVDDFAWVKEAMKLGAKDYILKPTMEPEQLLQIMEEARQDLEARRAERSRVEAWRQALEQSKQVQLNARLEQLLLQEREDPALELELFADGRQLRSLLLYRGLAGLDVAPDWEELGYSAAVRLDPDRLLLLYEEPKSAERAGSDTGFEARAARLLREMEGKQSSEDAVRVPGGFVGNGTAIRGLSELKLARKRHERQIEAWFYGDRSDPVVAVLPAGESPSGGVPGAEPLAYASRTDLLRAISHGNEAAVLFQAQELGTQLAEARLPLAELDAFLAELFASAARSAQEYGYAGADDFERHYAQPHPLRGCLTMEHVKQRLVQAFEELGSPYLRGAESGGSPPKPPSPFVRKAIQYMRANYSLNVSTAHIAEHVKLSRSYLSDLYSKETGESLIETLTRIRMDEAKKRLRQSGMKVYEVAEAVGFPDSKTFVKVFKRIVGCTPKEYELSNK
ncbi:response regulator [Paenibacillus sp. HJGM_3]|uniref:response regulator transcription factor n=1 Tax=Paenibacillus sp. HJGM_3 TaxID=3379816 RepID=UPI00385F37A8